VKRDAAYLRDMLVYIERIARTTEDGSAAFYADYRLQDAVIRQYEVIGEIVKRLDPALLSSATGFNWSQLKGFRDFLAHNYDKIELPILWGAVEQLPQLQAAVEGLLAALPPEENDGEAGT
jgi:uncharacterized protein with HEPN domain